MGDKQQAMPTGDEQAAAIKTTLAARREAMKQAWLKNDPSLVTHPSDVAKVKKLWNDRAGGFTSGGPPRIAGEEPNLGKWAKGQNINLKTGEWEDNPERVKNPGETKREKLKRQRAEQEKKEMNADR